MDSLFYEIYALLVIERLFPGSVDNIYKWESPDWKNNDNSLGIEVTRAQNKQFGYTNNVMAKYLGASKNQIPAKLLHNFRGGTYFVHGKLLAVSDSVGLVDGNRHVQFLLEKLEAKLKILNAAHFTNVSRIIYLNLELVLLQRTTYSNLRKVSIEFPLHTLTPLIK